MIYNLINNYNYITNSYTYTNNYINKKHVHNS